MKEAAAASKSQSLVSQAKSEASHDSAKRIVSSKLLIRELEAAEEAINKAEKEKIRRLERLQLEQFDEDAPKRATYNSRPPSVLHSNHPADQLPRVLAPGEESPKKPAHPKDRFHSVLDNAGHKFKYWREMIFFKEFVIYSLFLALFVGCSLSARPSGYAYWMTSTIRGELTDEEFLPQDAPNLKKTFMDVGNEYEFWQWLKGPLPSNLYPTQNGAGENFSAEESHYLNRLIRRIGTTRLRQLRVKPGTKCAVPPKFKNFIETCGGGYTVKGQDTEPFGPPDNPTKYTYSTRSELNGVFVWGFVESSYGGGGYVWNLPDDAASWLSEVEALQADGWLDPRFTRAVFLEFTLYNPGVNLFCVAQMLVEFPVSGGAVVNPIFRTVRLFRYQFIKDYVRLAFEIILMMFVLYYFYEEGLELYDQRLNYFKSVWNWYDILNLGLFIVVFVIRIIQVYKEGNLPIDDVNAVYGNEFINFQDVAFYASQEVNINAVNAFLCWFKIFKYVKMSRRLSQLSRTLSRAGVDIVNFLLMFMIVFFGYAHMGYMLFGAEVKGFRNYGVCLITLFRAIMGDFDFDEIANANRLVGPIFYVSYMVLVIMVLLNMFLAIINSAYTIVTTEDETRTTLLNFSGFFNEATSAVTSLFGLKKAKEIEDALQANDGQLDTDNDGKLDANELAKALGKGNEDNVEKIINAYDKDRDGKLDDVEYKRMMAELAASNDPRPRTGTVDARRPSNAGQGPSRGGQKPGAAGAGFSPRGGDLDDLYVSAPSVYVPPRDKLIEARGGTTHTQQLIYAKVDQVEDQLSRVLSHLDVLASQISRVAVKVDDMGKYQGGGLQGGQGGGGGQAFSAVAAIPPLHPVAKSTGSLGPIPPRL